MPPQEDANVEESAGDEETVEISKSDLQSLIRGQEELRQQVEEIGGSQVREMPSVSEREVTLLYVDESPVIGFANKGTDDKPSYVYKKRDPNDPTEQIAYVTALLYQGEGEEPRQIEVEYEDLLRNANKRDHKIIEKSARPWSEQHGKVRKKAVDGYATIQEDIVVPLTVKGETFIYTVRLDNGEELNVHEKWVNLA